MCGNILKWTHQITYNHLQYNPDHDNNHFKYQKEYTDHLLSFITYIK